MFRLQLARAARAHTARRAFTTTPVPRADPFPLPFDPKLATQHDASRNPDELIEEWTLPPPLDRTGETLEVTRARLVYQTRKRGTLETDLLLSTFARDHLPAMEGAEMAEFDKVGVLSLTYPAPRRTRLGHLLLGDREAARARALGRLAPPRKAQKARTQRGQGRPCHARPARPPKVIVCHVHLCTSTLLVSVRQARREPRKVLLVLHGLAVDLVRDAQAQPDRRLG